MMFSVGNRWDLRFLDRIAELNAQYSEKGVAVVELYGSVHSAELGLPSARPGFRLPEVPVEFVPEYIARAHSAGVRINYTVNAPLCEPVAIVASKRKRIEGAIRKLVDWGVDVFTVADTLLVEIIRERVDVPIEISSVLHARSAAQVPIYHDWGVTQVCMDVTRNRDISFLKAFCDVASKHGIETKLLANEFCSVDGVPCAGLYQADCVVHSALGGNPDDLFDGWPFKRCAKSRHANPLAWLKSRFILPQWLDLYAVHTSISYFKISGRTCETSWLLNTVESYMKKTFAGDIRDLCQDAGRQYIPSYTEDLGQVAVLRAGYLEKNRFIDHWFDNAEFRCDDHCGYDCTYCDSFCEKSQPFRFS